MQTVFMLFDIDGVLINPSGYRKAIHDTTRYFLDTLGFSKISINEEIITSFEAMGIISEWDMIPLYLLSIVDLALNNNTRQEKLNNIQECYHFFYPLNFRMDQDEIIEKVLYFKEFLEDGFSIFESILLKNYQQNSVEIFKNVRRFIPWLFKNWFIESRNVKKSELLQYFQNLTLGNDLFQKITGFDPFLVSEPYLKKYDYPILTVENVNKISSFTVNGNILPAIITARPSAFPNGVPSEKSQLNFPEAELALSCLNLEQIPCVGFGAFEYLGIHKNKNGDQFVKPSPIHALTAILHSSGLDLRESLECAYDYVFLKDHFRIVKYLSEFTAPINVCIFEDSAIGIQSLSKSCELLRRDGLEINMIAYGIATSENKKAALKKENAIIFPTINEAFSAHIDLLKI